MSATASDERAVCDLYHQLLAAWNARDAAAFAALFAEDGESVGFDGSQMAGRADIAATLGQIFADHPTAAYVATVRGVRFPAPDVAILRAVSGLVPPGKADLSPATNAVQTLVAAHSAGGWGIALFQNTPAQFHGRPELAEQLAEELRRLL